MPDTAKGLEGVVVAESSMGKVFGDEGKLIYRGIQIDELATQSNFEEVVFLLWNGRLPNRTEYDAFCRDMSHDRAVPAPILDLLRTLPADDSMATLRTATSALSAYDPDAEDYSVEAGRRKARRLTASLATLVAAIGRIRDGQEPIGPDASLSHAANFLFMLTGNRPSDVAARTFDQALVLHADHGFNASTFAARVTTSTLSDMHSAIVSAIGTLKGAAHGGANMRVMEMLLDIDRSGKTPEEWVRQKLSENKRIMGFGHRVYKVEDPRATHLRRSSAQLAQTSGNDKWFRMSERIEKVVREQKGLNPNVDFYSASTYYTLGIPTHLYTPIFAVSRISGWTGHVLEQMQNNRLIRPRSDYTGPTSVAYVPMSERRG
jgi:citrate synthase